MGKGGQTAKSAQKKVEVLIDGTYYDVTDWKDHPGGSVLKLYAGKDLDATQAFDNFHVRSGNARKYLGTFPSRKAPNPETDGRNKLENQASLLDDFNKLTQDLTDEGFFKPAPVHVVYRIVEVVLMHAVGFYLLFNTDYWLAGLAMLGLVSGRCGWLMHEGGHYSLTGVIPIDRTLQVIIYGVGCGMSAGWWRRQHNKHHSMPQKHGADPDLDTLPLVAFTKKVVTKGMGVSMKTWLRMQGFLFPVLTCQLVALGWQFFLHPMDIKRTLFVKHKGNKKLDMYKAGEVLALATRIGAWTYFITMPWGLATSAAMYLGYNWVASTYIFTNFAVSHTHLPVVDKDDEEVDWVRYAAVHTMNVNSGLGGWVDWWMSYLNFQIEHHLWPSMPQFRHPVASLRVQELFKKHNIPYNSMDYFPSMAVTLRNLDDVGSEAFSG